MIAFGRFCDCRPVQSHSGKESIRDGKGQHVVIGIDAGIDRGRANGDTKFASQFEIPIVDRILLPL